MTAEPPPAPGPGRPLVTSLTVADGTAVVAVAGEVDPATADQLAGAIHEARLECEHVVVDLSGVSFMDSAGLEVLIESRRRGGEDPGAFVLRAPTPALRRLLEITGLDAHLTVEG